MQEASVWHKATRGKFLTRDDPKVPEVIEGLDVVLFDHQRIAVKTMLDLEKYRRVKANAGDKLPMARDIYTSCGILAEPFGAGKTFECLALIKLSPQPDFKPISIYTEPTCTNGKSGYRLVTAGKVVRPNVIIIGASVFNQWLECIESVGGFTVLPVHNHKTLKDFNKIIDNDTINDYDIVLIKSGDVTASACDTNCLKDFFENYPFISESNTYSLASCVAIKTPNYIWSRIIIDDYDTIGLKTDAGASIGRFTWYISATQRRGTRLHRGSQYASHTIIDKSFNHRAMLDRNLLTYFKVANASEFIEECIKIYKPRFWVHYIKREYLKIIEFLANENELNDAYMEMINSDAIGTLAEAMGLKTNNIMDIFEKILEKKFTEYKDNLLYYANIKKAIEHCNKAFAKDIVTHRTDFKDVKRANQDRIKAGNITQVEWFPKIHEYLKDVGNRVKDKIDEQQKAINRLRDNFSNSECSICLLEFENNVFLLKCCGYTICENCVYKGTQMNKSNDKLSGSCPNCKKNIKFQDLITLDPNTDIKDLINTEELEKLITKEEANAKTPAQPADNKPYAGKMHPKVEALYNIINDKVRVHNQKMTVDELNRMVHKFDESNHVSYQVDKELHDLISSNEELDRPVGERKKVIVFANYCESLEIVKEQLGDITMTLGGTAAQMHSQINDFKTNNKTVLLINSKKRCAGLNIQFASDLVFFHKIIDPALEAQVEGRIQRMGRKYSANIHFILYNTEYL